MSLTRSFTAFAFLLLSARSAIRIAIVQLAGPAGLAASAFVSGPGTGVVLRWLIAVTGADGDALASLCAAAR